MIKIGIIGHTGRLGKTLVEILNKHPYAKIVYTESRKEGVEGNLSLTDLVFLALPHGESEKCIPRLNGKRLIDMSFDHRLNNKWVYGLSELNKDKIKDSKKIANPGCYATSIILGLAPLKGKVSEVSISSTSGISGAGIKVQEKDNFLVYQEGKMHPQLAEIKHFLGLEEILFVPQRIDTANRGIVSTIFARYDGNENIARLYQEFYGNCHFVRIKEGIETKNVNNTNFCDIKLSQFGNKVVIISALDNLIKGGSGQAVQNLNLMYGFDETTGLSKEYLDSK